MDSDDELREIDIKNCRYYYFGDMIKIEDFDINKIFIDEKPLENVFLYNISSKSLVDSKPLCVTLDKIDGFVRVYDGTRILVIIFWQFLII